MRNFIDSLKARRDAAKNEGGFSLIDVVVTVAIIVALSVGGFVSYSGIVENAKAAATASAADQVYTAVAVNANDGGLADPTETYNNSSSSITVVTDGTRVAAFHEEVAGSLTEDSTVTEVLAVKDAATDGSKTDKLIAVRG